MKPGVAPRVAAVDNLHRILVEGAHSNVLLDKSGAELGTDRALVQRLTLDTLRWIPLVDERIGAMAERPIGDIDESVLNVLRVGLTELHLGGDPHGVVDSAVEAARVLGVGRATGFVNAMLRRTVRGDVPALPTADAAALERGMPPWIWSELVAGFGAAEVAHLVEGLNQPAPIGIRMRSATAPAAGRPVGIPHAYVVDRRRDVAALGDAAVVMDPASTAVAAALAVQPGDTVIDVAAAPGNKTSALWDALAGEGLLIAGDAHARRTKRARRRMRRLQVDAVWLVADAVAPAVHRSAFDRVLLDAPCTGLGTLRRRPEIKLRIAEDSPPAMGRLQRSLLEASLELVRPGGRLVYATCTLFRQETIDVVAGLGARPPADLPGKPFGDGALLAPHTTGTDGMFIAIFDR